MILFIQVTSVSKAEKRGVYKAKSHETSANSAEYVDPLSGPLGQAFDGTDPLSQMAATIDVKPARARSFQVCYT